MLLDYNAWVSLLSIIILMYQYVASTVNVVK